MFFQSYTEVSVTANALGILCLLLIYVGIALTIIVFSLLVETPEPHALTSERREANDVVVKGGSIVCKTKPGLLQNLSSLQCSEKERVGDVCGGSSSHGKRGGRRSVDESRKKSDRAVSRRQSLPSAETWPERPVFVRFYQPDVYNLEAGYNLPRGHLALNPPLDAANGAHSFETPLFKGTVVFRVAGVNSSDSTSYFQGKRRLMDTVIQGRFKTRMCMKDVLTGQFFDLPWGQRPPRWLIPVIFRIVRYIHPATKMNIDGKHPFIVSPLASACQNLHVADPEIPHSPYSTPPDIVRDQAIPEQTTLLGGEFSKSIVTAQKRRRILSDLSLLREFWFDPKFVYTFDFYQHLFNLATYDFKIGVGNVSLVKYMNGQPIEINAFVDPGLDLDGDRAKSSESQVDSGKSYLWRIEAWQENLLTYSQQNQF
eukprot:Selendium_serpulae@DN6121_c0_g1_i12.p1